jgi:tetratricopeptide (TPR) repeat protein
LKHLHETGDAATYAGLGDFGRALQEFGKSVDLCPENAWVYYNLAEAYQNNGDRKNAVENYKLALVKNKPKLTLGGGCVGAVVMADGVLQP